MQWGIFMISKKTMIAASIIPLALALAGCKHNDKTAEGPGSPGGPSGPGGGLVAGDYIASTTTDTAAAAVKDGKSLSADATNSSTIGLAYGAGTAKAMDPAAFSVKKNAEGGMDMTVNGETVSFAGGDKYEEDGTSYEWENSGGFLSSMTAETKDILDGTDKNYLNVWQYSSNKGDAGTTGYAVVGAETAPDTVKAMANATYKGDARVDTRQVADITDRAGVRGNLTLNAKFDQGTVSGSIDSVEARTRNADTGNKWTGWAPVSGAAISLTESKISANGFTGGTVVGNAAANSAIDGNLDGSTYSGRFYGPNAEQVGGAISAMGTSEGGKFVGTGYFAGNKQ
jgi:hypothetical protein